jgi:hypothetical protein
MWLESRNADFNRMLGQDVATAGGTFPKGQYCRDRRVAIVQAGSCRASTGRNAIMEAIPSRLDDCTIALLLPCHDDLTVRSL